MLNFTKKGNAIINRKNAILMIELELKDAYKARENAKNAYARAAYDASFAAKNLGMISDMIEIAETKLKELKKMKLF